LRRNSVESPARVLIADHSLTRLTVRMALEQDHALAIETEAGHAEQAIVEAERTQPDVCLVGWDIPGGGLATVRGISLVAPHCAVVALASTRNADDLLAAVRSGAIGYVDGGTTSEGLRKTVHAVLLGEAAVPRSMVRDIVLELRTSSLVTTNVSEREGQVLTMLRGGHSTADIARRLQISPITVRRHISELVQKFGVSDREGLLRGDQVDRPSPDSGPQPSNPAAP
jgi:DNA-binding NarL/FixJ family response regulator